METTLKFDKVVLVKELNDKFKKVGEVFEIANILDNSFLLRDTKTRIAIGVVNFDDFERCFVHKENFKGWTQWAPLTGFDGQTDVLYRTNHKKVQVKFITDKVRGECSCHRDDEFNLFFGVQIAYLRALNKALNKKAAEHVEELKKINREIIDNERIVQKMVNSLEVKNEAE